MKPMFILIAWSALAATILWLAFNPTSGVAYQSPLACLGLGLIGAALCRWASPAPAEAPVQQRR